MLGYFNILGLEGGGKLVKGIEKKWLVKQKENQESEVFQELGEENVLIRRKEGIICIRC